MVDKRQTKIILHVTRKRMHDGSGVEPELASSGRLQALIQGELEQGRVFAGWLPFPDGEKIWLVFQGGMA